MKISTKGRYALRLMLDLATYNTGEPVSLKDISRRQEISEKYLEQIIATLNRGGLVHSIRGAKGGYKLTRSPEDITAGMVLRCTEGSLAPVACVEGDAIDCERVDRCVTVRIYRQLNDAINGVVDNITLADMVEWQNEQLGDFSI